MEWQKDSFVISDDRRRLDEAFIINALHQSYWASKRDSDAIARSLDTSLCFGVYHGAQQVGFARAVTDDCFFTWICDVVIDPAFRGLGLGKWLMACLVEHPRLRHTKQILATRDAHGLYEKYGFTRREMMIRQPSQ